MDSIIKRRIKFLLDAAKDEDIKDQAISYVMRTLSNHATIGKDANSASIKKINRKATENAYKLLKEKGIKIYCKETINEHPKPLEQTWQWLKENAHTLSIDDVWKEFCKYTMVTVTKEEDDFRQEPLRLYRGIVLALFCFSFGCVKFRIPKLVPKQR